MSSRNSPDEMRANLTDDEHAIINDLPDLVDSDAEWYRDCHTTYHLPSLRIAVALWILLLIDAVCTNTLWLLGGDGQFMINSITSFEIGSSVFDLAVQSFVQWLILFYLGYKSESRALSSLSKSTPSSWRLPAVLGVVLSCLGFLYSVIKAALVLALYTKKSTILPATYYAATISRLPFSLIELVLSALAIWQLKHTPKIAIKKMYNKFGQELDESGQPLPRKVDLKRLMKLAVPEAPMILIGCFCLLITSGSSIVAPYFFGQVVDAAQTSMDALNRTIVTLFLIYCTYGIAGFFRAWLFELAGQRLVARIRATLFAAIIKQDIEFFDITRTGELTNRLSSDTQVIQSAITVNISMLLRNMILITGSLVFMFALNPPLTGILLAVVPIISLSAVQYGNMMKKLRKDFQDKLADAGTVAEEAISSIRTVRSFNGETKASHSYDTEIYKSYDVAKKLALLTGLFNGWVSISAFGAICLAMWYGGKLVFDGQLSVGILTSFLVYTVQIAGCLAIISSLYGDFMQAIGASERMFDILDKKPKIVCSSSVADQPQRFIPDVMFEDVHFSYPSRPEYAVLKGLSLHIKPGQVVALVGPSGGGKSTIVSLIERFYDCNSGTISISGLDVKQLDPLWFRTRLSLVSQEPTLFACSIRDNIAYGTDASLDQVIEAAKQSNAHNFIQSFPDGYETMVGERGVRLSGGQKQRIAIARSLITDPALLLLDEATSALDAESEQLVQEAIDRAMTGRTVLIIAHRLSTVRNADQVVVIDKGIIAEQGTHDELLVQDGVYKKLVLKQLEAGGKAFDSD